ncbi:hypothetical protein NM688_g4395 [Phlebia brevispora]|uniref:Uncharacterized protein n=1 Tax=Phlebia brevispora TaxID=194682 RepID=A0ACC1T334_9APHY|nr:hypothetical protein NM688_g4395 [Phlebia brevispora]
MSYDSGAFDRAFSNSNSPQSPHFRGISSPHGNLFPIGPGDLFSVLCEETKNPIDGVLLQVPRPLLSACYEIAAMPEHVLPRPDFVHLADVHPRPHVLSMWERRRHRQAHWFVECVAEAMGVFLYVYAGVGSTASYIVGTAAKENLSSPLQIGFAYALGIVFALVTCGSTSGGHFNPAVSIAFVLFKKFPPLKALRYIIAQILGAYIACMLVYVQWNSSIKGVEAGLIAEGAYDTIMFSPEGPAGIFALYVLPGSKLGQVFLNEFVCDFVIGLIIWACLDPTNFLIPPALAPWLVSSAYTMVIWGFSPVGLATNTARDLGARFMTMSIWGIKASGGTYAAIAALTNIPATLCAIMFYEVFLADSSRVITQAHVEVITGHLAHSEHSEQKVVLGAIRQSTESYSPEEKEV